MAVACGAAGSTHGAGWGCRVAGERRRQAQWMRQDSQPASCVRVQLPKRLPNVTAIPLHAPQIAANVCLTYRERGVSDVGE